MAHKWEYRIVSCDTSKSVNEEQRVLDMMGESRWECFHVDRHHTEVTVTLTVATTILYFKRGVDPRERDPALA